MLKSNLRIVTIADVHCGAFDADEWYKQMTFIVDKVEEIEEFDAVIIAGDYFHKKLSANSDHMKAGMRIFFRLFKICMDRDAYFRIIKGTESHDNSQLELFNELQFVSNGLFKLFSTLGDEMLFPNLKVLYVPEEYKQGDEYYNEYLDGENTYDFIFGHGMTDLASFVAKVQESEDTHPSAPIFEVGALLKNSTGGVYFGHIHKRMQKKRFRYIGSPFTWAFGETDDKGFMVTDYDTEKRKIIKETFVHNDLVTRYDTWRYKPDDAIFKTSPDEIIRTLMVRVKDYNIGYLRLHLTIPEEYPDSILLIHLLNEVFAFHEFIRLKVEDNAKITRREKLKNEMDEALSEYSFLFDKSLTEDEKIQSYIEMKYGRNIPIEKIKNHLYKPFKGVKP